MYETSQLKELISLALVFRSAQLRAKVPTGLRLTKVRADLRQVAGLHQAAGLRQAKAPAGLRQAKGHPRPRSAST